ncbi:MAG: thioredoxin-disulfide reductase [Clostridiales bacterium]|nr:MAG: thioredoxin-disulfide reductase [Clostridiales bacterium]
MYDILTIGGGPAGLTAAIYGARAGLSVAVVEKAVPGGQITSTHQLENYPGFAQGISGAEFSQQLLEQAKRVGAQVLTDEILSLQLEGKVKKAEGKAGSYQAKTMILALGAAPRKLEIPGEQQFTGMGVSYCATCDGAFFKGLRVAVIGGGDTAFEDARYLSDLAAEVYLVHRRDTFRAQQYLVEKAKAKENIHFIKQAVPVEICGGMDLEYIVLQDVQTGKRQELAVEGVFAAVGQKPNTELVQGKIALDAAGYIEADENTRTNIPGIFAAGDVRKKRLRQVVTAAADGAVAAMEAYHTILEED